VIDLHSHVLPGIDDGPPTLEGSLALARAAAAGGTRTLAATPHIDHRHGVDPAELPGRVRQVSDALRAEGIPLTLVAGGEIALSRSPDLTDEELRSLCLGSGSFLLVESPHVPTGGGLEPALFDLQVRGFRVLLAHPERSPVFLRDRERLRQLVSHGAMCSITAGSIAGRFGRTVRAYALELLREGLVHDVASDSHDDTRRPPELRDCFAGADRDLPGLSGQAQWLGHDAPAAILAGRELPPRPELPPQRHPWLGRLRRASLSR
jgi:protein-tyrosine phosphatase